VVIDCPVPSGSVGCWAVDVMGTGGMPTPLASRYLAAKFDDPTLSASVAAEFAERVDLDALDGLAPIDAVVCVPSRTPVAAVFASLLASCLARPLAPAATLRWTRDVPALKGVDPAERQALVADALAATPIAGSVLLVDDVVRTTATLSEATRALRAAGAERVACLTMLRVD